MNETKLFSCAEHSLKRLKRGYDIWDTRLRQVKEKKKRERGGTERETERESEESVRKTFSLVLCGGRQMYNRDEETEPLKGIHESFSHHLLTYLYCPACCCYRSSNRKSTTTTAAAATTLTTYGNKLLNIYNLEEKKKAGKITTFYSILIN